jgi:hypothetical protein
MYIAWLVYVRYGHTTLQGCNAENLELESSCLRGSPPPPSLPYLCAEIGQLGGGGDFPIPSTGRLGGGGDWVISHRHSTRRHIWLERMLIAATFAGARGRGQQGGGGGGED